MTAEICGELVQTVVHPLISSHPGGVFALDSQASDKSASPFHQK